MKLGQGGGWRWGAGEKKREEGAHMRERAIGAINNHRGATGTNGDCPEQPRLVVTRLISLTGPQGLAQNSVQR